MVSKISEVEESFGAGISGSAENPTIRKDFPETWLWESTSDTGYGSSIVAYSLHWEGLSSSFTVLFLKNLYLINLVIKLFSYMIFLVVSHTSEY